ncbi:MAG TPA: nucleotidyltransferase domain-containing protein [Alphaproteobacteria bacterium]|nr:nucleotidyltransferase domain-containing protein [Alphaproteobacteria bacterium]
MAKSNKKGKPNKDSDSNYSINVPAAGENSSAALGIDAQMPADMPPEAKKRWLELKENLEKFKSKVMEKFSDYVLGISLLPPPKPEVDPETGKETEVDKNKVYVLVLVDDSDSKKMSKEELKEKLSTIIQGMAQEVDPKFSIDTLLLTELWQSCYDAKYDYLQAIAMGMTVYDKGMMAAIKISEIHKSMVLKKFEKYIVTYVLAGSLVQGRATPKSDIDVFIVIDDTDVKKMTRAELKDKLRAIIIGMGIDAGKMTGVENKINIQVYILTDFWDSVKEANPVIFTFLRDGVPFYDRGIFMPWKQLLQMGRVKPSPEAIDMFMHSGDQLLDRVSHKLTEIATEDFFWATLTPTQAAIMLYGLPPPTPKETPEVVRDIFVKKEKLLEEKYVQIIERILKIRKDIEHGDKKTASGEEIDKLLSDSKDYLKRINELFKQIERLKEEHGIRHHYESIVTIVRDILKLEGVEKVTDTEIIHTFESEVIHKGLVPEKYLRIFKDLVKAKKDYDVKRLNKTEVFQINKDAQELIKFLVEYIQRKRSKDIERARIRVKHGNRFGEVILLGKTAFIIHDIDNEDKEISSATVTNDGRLANIKQSNLEELEKAIANTEAVQKSFIKESIFEQLKSIFGKDVEILVNY